MILNPISAAQRLCGVALALGIVLLQNLASADEAAIARNILETAGFRGRLIVHVGCGDGKLTVALRTGNSFIVQGLDSDVTAARQTIRAAGLSGQVSAEPWSGGRLPYAENLVNLLVLQRPVPVAELLRVLAPRGVALQRGPDGTWQKTTKPWPAEMDEWSHWEHAADGNPVSQDMLVGPPRQIQWVAGPRYSKQHWGPRIGIAVTAGGRFFTIEDETPTSVFNLADRWVLIARDAFNGTVLWRQELPQWASGTWRAATVKPQLASVAELQTLGLFGNGGGKGGREALQTMVAAGDRLFVALAANDPVTVLDAATGNKLRTLTEAPSPREMVLADGVLLISSGREVCAVNPDTGAVSWRIDGSDPAAKDGRVYFLQKKGRALACCDLKTGRPVWESAGREGDRPAFAGQLQVGAGIVLLPASENKKTTYYAFSAADGRLLWQLNYRAGPFARGGGPFILRDLVWVLQTSSGKVEARDPQTGKVRTEVDAPSIQSSRPMLL